MNKKKLSILTAVVAISLCTCSKITMAAPSKILTFTNMPVWDYHKTNYDKDGNIRITTGKTTFNLNEKEEKVSHIPVFNIEEVEVNSPIVIKCEFKKEEQKNWFNNINKITKEDSTKNPNLEQSLEFEKNEDELIIKANQRALDNNGLYNIKVYSSNYDSIIIPVNIVQSKPIKVLVSYPMNPRTGEDVRFKLENFNYAVINPITKVFLTHNNKRKELVKFDSYHPLSDSITVYAKDDETGEGNLLEPGQYTLEIYADGFKKVEKKFEVLKNEVKSNEKNSINKKLEPTSLILKSKKGIKSSFSSIDTLSSASVATSEGADDSGSEGNSGGSVIMHSNLIYNHDLLANALILKELGIGTTESEAIADRFELNTISYDAVVSEDGTHINDFEDYLNAVKDAALNGDYLTYDNYISSENAKEYKNRPYNVKEVLEDNLLGQAKSFRDTLGLKTPNLEVKTSVKDKDMVIQCNDINYLSNIKSIKLNGDGRDISKDLYSIKGNELIINSKLITGDKIQLRILSKGYKDKVIEAPLEKVLDKVDLKLNKEYKTGQNIVVTGLTSDFVKNIKSIKINNKSVLTRDQEGNSSDTYYTISGDNLILQSGLFKDAREYKLEIEGKYYGKKELIFTITKSEEKPKVDESNKEEIKKKLPKMNIKVDSKPMFMKKYDIKFENAGEWINNVTGISVNNTEYKLGLAWGQTSGHYAIYKNDELIGIGSDNFKSDNDNVVTVKAKGYDDLTFIIKNDGTVSCDKKEQSIKNDVSVVEGKNEVPKMKITLNKDSFFMKKYDIKFNGNSEKWMEKITKISVDGVEYEKGIQWGNEKNHYSIHPVDYNISIGYEGLKTDEENVVKISSEGYKDFILNISKDGKLVENK
ncbi:hemoblobin-interacting domain-containing protein [Clostridium tarantellae]|uniref:DUF1533 domain-containing protein n=1 Tax=Clostridium tarantellae TaxID=39493 RepID=A0A6I1MLA1_9CLOT|nr:hemoblobin-interacting domain-containing protein [Clostridium tarantellae]MPQ44286.1 DUF1533 domain-containing protein [Clostridium tarantellae]